MHVNLKNSHLKSKNRQKNLVVSKELCTNENCDGNCNGEHLPSTADDYDVNKNEIFPGQRPSNELKDEQWEHDSASDARKDAIYNLNQSAYGTISRLDHTNHLKLGQQISTNQPIVNMKARKERNKKFVSYIREQMMQEYGFDLNELHETFGYVQEITQRNISPMAINLTDLRTLKKKRDNN